MTAENKTKLEPEFAEALEAWIIAIMKEATGPGMDGQFITKGGLRVYDVSFKIADVFTAIYDRCPEAVAMMLKAGAAGYTQALPQDDHAIANGGK